MAATLSLPQRRLPWDVMGPALAPSSATDLDAALEAAGLTYTVKLGAVQAVEMTEPTTHSPGGLPVQVLSADGFRSVLRPGPDGKPMCIGITGRRFRPIQNADAFEVARYLIAEFGAEIVGAADFRSGTASILVLDLKRGLEIGPEADQVETYLVIKNVHSGEGSLQFALTPVRMQCTNMLRVALAKAEHTWSINHTPRAAERIKLAEEAIQRSLVYADTFAAEAERMMAAELTTLEFEKIISRIWPNPAKTKTSKGEPSAALQRAIETRTAVTSIFTSSPTLAGIQGTRWAGLNAITEYAEHFRTVRTGSHVGTALGGLTEDVARAEGTLQATALQHFRDRAWKVMAR